jgi:hypothetical protein
MKRISVCASSPSQLYDDNNNRNSTAMPLEMEIKAKERRNAPLRTRTHDTREKSIEKERKEG